MIKINNYLIKKILSYSKTLKTSLKLKLKIKNYTLKNEIWFNNKYIKIN